MIELITKIAEFYPQISSYLLFMVIATWSFYKIFGAFKDLGYKIDSLGQRMATKDDLQAVKDDLNAVKMKVGIIEEKVDVLWKHQLRIDGGLDYNLPLVRDDK